MRVTKRFHTEELELNMTPMIDIVFQLIIFFLVVSEFASYDRIADLTLPSASEAKAEDVAVPDRLIISVDRLGRIWIAGRERTMADVDRYLRVEKNQRGEERGKKTGLPVLIQADRNAAWRVIQDVIEKANELKIWRLSFATKKEEG